MNRHITEFHPLNQKLDGITFVLHNKHETAFIECLHSKIDFNQREQGGKD